MLPRTLLATALAAVAALGAAAGPAAAKRHPAKSKAPKAQKEHRFLATFEATYKTTWDQPRAGGGGNCSGHSWVRGGGSETWTVKTRTPQKVLIWKTGYGLGIHNSWNPQGDHGDLEAFGVLTRDGQVWTDTEPGWCGGEFASIPMFPNPDCGTRLPEYRLHFVGTETYYPQLEIAPHMRREKLGFTNCPIQLAQPLTAGTWPKVEKALPAKKVLGKAKEVKVTGEQAWDNADVAAEVGYTTASSMTWTLTLTRK